MRVGVNEGSAYDLFLSRTLTHAEGVRGPNGIDLFREQRLEAAAGIRPAFCTCSGISATPWSALNAST